MTQTESVRLDHVFHALSDATRRAVLRRVAQRPHTVNELAEPFDISLNAVSKHLKVLERAQLITRQKQGRTHYCQLDASTMKFADDWLQFYKQFWSNRLDSLGQFLQDSSGNPPKPTDKEKP